MKKKASNGNAKAIANGTNTKSWQIERALVMIQSIWSSGLTLAKKSATKFTAKAP
jgi:hypothetical protein